MTPQEEYRREKRLYGAFVAFIGLLIIAISIWGCSPRIVEHTIVQHDTTKVVQRDSVTFYDRDSIFVKEKGDTVYKYVEKWRWRDRVKIDTFVRVQVDSVAYETVREVQKPLSGFVKFQMCGFWLLLALGVVVGIVIIKK